MIYDRRLFWIQTILFILLVAVSYLPYTGNAGSNWRMLLWLDSPGSSLLWLFFFNILIALMNPTFSLWWEERMMVKGKPVVLSAKHQAYRRMHWTRPVPWFVWTIVFAWYLLVFASWTELFPRLFFGYLGTIGQDTYVAWHQEVSPDGRWIALEANPLSNTKTDNLSIMSRDTGRTIAYPLADYARDITWSHDSRWVAAKIGDNVNLLEVSTGQLKPLKFHESRAFAFHPNGCLWLLSGDELWSWDPGNSISMRLLDKNATSLHLDSGCLDTPNTFALSRDGSLLLFSYGRKIRIFETRNMQEMALWDAPFDIRGEVRFGRNNQLLMAWDKPTLDDTSVIVLDAMKGTITNKITGLRWSPVPMDDVDISSDGRWITVLRKDECVAVWSLASNQWVWSAPAPSRPGDKCPRFMPDGREITTVCFTEHDFFKSKGRCVRRWNWKSSAV